jgi:hypothetical protein
MTASAMAWCRAGRASLAVTQSPQHGRSEHRGQRVCGTGPGGPAGLTQPRREADMIQGPSEGSSLTPLCGRAR